MKKKMLLHSCCAPCTSGVAWQLTDYDITLLFYNPNLDSINEYNRRLEALEMLIEKLNADYNYDLKLIAIPYDHKEFSDKIIGLENEKEGGARCFKCYRLRMEETAKKDAAVRAFDENVEAKAERKKRFLETNQRERNT